MRMATLAAAAAALLASTAAAFAVQDTGTVVHIEWSTGTFTLDNGNVYILPPYLQATHELMLGDQVKVTYEDMIVSAIAVTPPSSG